MVEQPHGVPCGQLNRNYSTNTVEQHMGNHEVNLILNI
jgi:hypothetical protein